MALKIDAQLRGFDLTHVPDSPVASPPTAVISKMVSTNVTAAISSATPIPTWIL